MKRIGNIWDSMLEETNGINAVIEGTRKKRKSREIKKLLYDEEAVNEVKNRWHRVNPEKAAEYVQPIIEELRNGTWKHSSPRCKRQFCKSRTHTGGKWRELYITNLKDHTVAHMVMNVTEKAFLKGMHPGCCGSVPGRGIRYALKRIRNWMQHDKQCRYFVKLDIRHFFDNINGDVLKKKLAEKIKDKDVLQVFGLIIDSAPVACPVGYYTSPWLANLYLEKLDWFITQQLYKERREKRINFVRHYIRYADDMLLIGTSKADLKSAIYAVRDELSKIGLELKPEWEIKKIGKHVTVNGKWKLKKGTYWCDIVGYRFCKDSVQLRDGIYLASTRLARKMYKQQYYTKNQCESINARLGWAAHCDSRRFLEDCIKPYVNIKLTRRIIGCGSEQKTVKT